jgi:hypothetical protein
LEFLMQGSTKESAMTAMNWLATQLAWEQRLAELRAEKRPSKLNARKQTREASAARKAA